jgi:hypothetical protein
MAAVAIDHWADAVPMKPSIYAFKRHRAVFLLSEIHCSIVLFWRANRCRRTSLTAIYYSTTPNLLLQPQTVRIKSKFTSSISASLKANAPKFLLTRYVSDPLVETKCSLNEQRVLQVGFGMSLGQ